MKPATIHQYEILRSRVESTHVLGAAMRETRRPPPVWIQMSTAHIYGDPPSDACSEAPAIGYELAPTLAKEWEAAFAERSLPEQRGVVMRSSFVSGRNRGGGSGAIATLRLITKFRLDGKVGKGTQGMSWIHEADLNAIFSRAIPNNSMSGPHIVSSPHPKSQQDFLRTLRKSIGMPIGLPAFEWMVRIGGPLFLTADPELVFYGRYVLPKRLLEEGFEFRFADLGAALHDVPRSLGIVEAAHRKTVVQ